MDNCEDCKRDREWKERYNLSCKRFDKSLNLAMTITIISLFVTLFCIILTAFCLAATIRFISGFEYVEETETVIEQDGNGQNIAVLLDGS